MSLLRKYKLYKLGYDVDDESLKFIKYLETCFLDIKKIKFPDFRVRHSINKYLFI